VEAAPAAATAKATTAASSSATGAPPDAAKPWVREFDKCVLARMRERIKA